MEEQDMIPPLDYSSGCTSGWTMYLDQSWGKPGSLSGDEEAVFPCKNNGRFAVEEEEETTDLSMVSDASSGPPHLHDADDGRGHGFYVDQRERWFCKTAALVNEGGKRRTADKGGGEDGPSSLLADTASSHHLSFPQQRFNPRSSKMASSVEVEDVLDFSIGFSTTHFDGKSALQKHCGFLDTSLPLNPTSKAKPRRRHEEDMW